MSMCVKAYDCGFWTVRLNVHRGAKIQDDSRGEGEEINVSVCDFFNHTQKHTKAHKHPTDVYPVFSVLLCDCHHTLHVASD